jgi:hypothetical protein
MGMEWGDLALSGGFSKETLFDKEDASPLMSRCLRLDLARRDLAKPFAERCRQIAQAEGLDGLPIERYVKLLQQCRNNCRPALQAVEAGEMLQYPPGASTRKTLRSIRERGVFSCRVPGLLHCLLHKPTPIG